MSNSVPTTPPRLSKILASQIGCSKRDAELYIEGGWVTVNGVLCEDIRQTITDETVALLPNAQAKEHKPVTILFHKPVGVKTADLVAQANTLFTAETQIDNDRSGVKLTRKATSNLILATPLEMNASGFVVLTQDKSILQLLSGDIKKLEQEYIVEVDGELSEAGLKRLNFSCDSQGKPMPSLKVSWQNETRLRFAVKGVKIGYIAHWCDQEKLDVISMKRIRVGRLPMSGLVENQWRFMLGYEKF